MVAIGRFLGTSRTAKRQEREHVEREQMARLEKAEGDLTQLKARAARAIGLLDDRQSRNHFADALRISLGRN